MMSLEPKKKAELDALLRAYVGLPTGPPETGVSPVNEPMIRHWCEVLGDRNPVYTDAERAARSIHAGLVAPPAMLQAWVLHGVAMAIEEEVPRNKQVELHRLLDAYGYGSVVGTNVEQHYHRYLRPGERVTVTMTIDSISEEKATAIGVGYFIETLDRFTDEGGAEVGWMRFRSLRYRPHETPKAAGEASAATRPAAPTRLAPPLGHDNAWWWEGIARGELLIQSCDGCGALRHPPRPMCPKCQSLEFSTRLASGRGSVHSFTVLHHPKFPGFEYPFVAALIDLEEGTRLVSNVIDVDPGEVHIGMRVQASIEQVDAATKLPVFRPLR